MNMALAGDHSPLARSVNASLEKQLALANLSHAQWNPDNEIAGCNSEMGDTGFEPVTPSV
jgi:hypothetical protein